jgi:hypothetical protein
MTVSTTEFRHLGKSDRLPDSYVNPYYLEDLKRRVSVARVAGALYAFDDLCPQRRGSALRGAAHRQDVDVPVRRLAV